MTQDALNMNHESLSSRLVLYLCLCIWMFNTKAEANWVFFHLKTIPILNCNYLHYFPDWRKKKAENLHMEIIKSLLDRAVVKSVVVFFFPEMQLNLSCGNLKWPNILLKQSPKMFNIKHIFFLFKSIYCV